MKESIVVMFIIFGLSICSYFVTKTEKERGLASGKVTTPVGYQK